MAQIQTTKGLIEEVLLERREVTEPINGGTSYKTEYYLAGELVKRDIHIKMNPPTIVESTD